MSSFLKEYSRQAKLYIDLPSQGHYYDDKEVLKDKEYTSVPVFGMNAMDEITFKTPDALLSGTATTEVMQSCIPHIQDPWSIVGFDIDYILIAIRIATYGDTMNIETACPHCSAVHENDIMLTKILENFANCPVTNSFDVDGFKINLRPLSYRENTDFSMQNFALERQVHDAQFPALEHRVGDTNALSGSSLGRAAIATRSVVTAGDVGFGGHGLLQLFSVPRVANLYRRERHPGRRKYAGVGAGDWAFIFCSEGIEASLAWRGPVPTGSFRGVASR